MQENQNPPTDTSQAAAELREAIGEAFRSGAASVEDLGVEWTEEGMIVHRPTWCRSDEQWRKYSDALRAWWAAYWDGFRADAGTTS